MRDAKITDTGCYLNNHRGHYIGSDTINLAVGFGFIIGPFEQFAVGLYTEFHDNAEYPHEGMIELCDDAVNWLNSGQDKCDECAVGSGDIRPGQVAITTTDGKGVVTGHAWVICKVCSGSGRGPRIAGQNFPPRVPDNYVWSFNDGDFGLYPLEDLID